MKKPTLASCLLGLAGLAVLFGCAPPALAGRLLDVSIVNRSTGERLTPWRHAGKLYVAGTPGERYAIELTGRRGERVLAVLAVDGINVLSGQTAATLQSGYVIDGWQRHAVSGWRKSMDDVAQFVFTALPDSYAARTGRPADVGVIGVAVYRERVVPPASPALDYPWSSDSRARDGASAAPAAKAQNELSAAAGGALAERRADQAQARAESAAPSMKLGTGHGPREHSPTRYTEFARNGDTPDEIITIYYDSRANLIARGIIPVPRLAEPRPFPAGVGFVPDPQG